MKDCDAEAQFYNGSKSSHELLRVMPMNEDSNLHPSPDSLSRFMGGRLQGAEDATVGDHIVDCEVCCARLAELIDDEDPLLTMLKSDVFLPNSPATESDLSTSPSVRSRFGTDAGTEQKTGEQNRDPNDKRIGPYRLLGILGEGGMGCVYKARHERLNRLVALKTTYADRLRDPQFAIRFSLEAESIARLKHPNIVQIYDVGRHNEQPYFAMELVDGDSLDAVIRRQSFCVRDAAEIVRALADAIHAAHQMGVVHRDLKPSNVLLDASYSTDGVTAALKITDFGIAKQLDSDSNLTHTGMVAGTPNYMAPEQVRGRSEQIGPHTDVYALGVMLYELLTGRTPFMAVTPREVMNQILDREAPSPKLFGATAPPDLVSICLQCLHKEPARRYASAQALAEDLGHFLAGETVEARQVGFVERSGRWCRRRPALTALLSVVTLLAFVGFPGVAWLWLDASAAKVVAERSDAAQRWSSYRANVASAGSFLQLNNVSAARRALDAAPEEHRNWEWNHFEYRLQGAQRIMRGHEAAVWGLAISPDGRLLASASHDSTVRMWNAETGDVIATLAGQDLSLYHSQLDFSPDGRLLLAPGPDGSASIWDAQSCELRASLTEHSLNVISCGFSYDGTCMFTQTRSENSLRLWDTETAKLIKRIVVDGTVVGATFCPISNQIAIHQGNGWVSIWNATNGDQVSRWHAHEQVTMVTFSPDGKLLATAGGYGDGEIKLWVVPNGGLKSVLQGHQNAVHSIDFSPDGSVLASGGQDSSVGLWDVRTGELLAMHRDHAGPILQVAFSPDGSLLASASRDHTVRLWDPTGGNQIALLHGHTDTVLSLVFDQQSKMLYSASQDKTIAAWDVGSRKKTGILRGHTQTIGDTAFSPDGSRCASASWDGSVRIWDVNQEKQLLRLPTDAPIATGVVFHPSGDQVAAVDRKSLTVWDANSGKQLFRERLPDGRWPDRRVAISPDGKLLVTGTVSGEVFWWNAETWQQLAKTPAHAAPCRDVAFSPDSCWLVSVGDDEVAHVWNTHTRERIATLRGHEGKVTCAGFNHSGTMIVTGSEDGTARIWDARDYTPMATLQHGSYVYDVAFRLGGERLAVGCDNHSIRLWDVATWTDVGHLLGHQDYVWSLSFSPDGTRILSGSGDHTLRIWKTLSPSELVRPSF